jgi:hypothetical protein
MKRFYTLLTQLLIALLVCFAASAMAKTEKTPNVTPCMPGGITISLTPTPENCNGGANGSASATVSGGATPYSYTWSPTPSGGQGTSTATGLGAGTYTLTVQDNLGVTTSATTVITQPTAITITTSSTNSSCGQHNGSATIMASGGSPTYTYSWYVGGTAATQTNLDAGTYTVTVTDTHGCEQNVSVNVNNTPGPSANVTSTSNVNCNGNSNGSATVTATGGTGTYTYNWSPAIGGGQGTAIATGLSAGSYTCTISDANNCIITSLATITQPALFTSTASPTSVTCFGGTNGVVDVIPSGGTAPISYSWNTGYTGTTLINAPVGSYTCTMVDANGCMTTSAATITQPTLLTVLASGISTSCGHSNGQAICVPSGGTAGYTYSWNPLGQTGPSMSGLIPGTYTVFVTDIHGCTSSDTAIVNSQAGANSMITSSTNVLCSGSPSGTATVAASAGTAPFSYNWSPVVGGGQGTTTVTGLSAGTYTATITDANGCTSLSTVTITQPAPLNIVTTTSTSESCNTCCDASATINPAGGTPPYIYSWSGTPHQTTQTATNLCAGTYTACVMDANGCDLCENPVVSYNVGISSYADNSSLQLYPNPATDRLNIVLTSASFSETKMELLSILGEAVYSEQIPAAHAINRIIDLSKLKPGVYFVSITSAEKRYCRRILKN